MRAINDLVYIYGYGIYLYYFQKIYLSWLNKVYEFL